MSETKLDSSDCSAWTKQEERDLTYYVEDAWQFQWPGWEAIKNLMRTESHHMRSASAYRQKYDRMKKQNTGDMPTEERVRASSDRSEKL